MTRNVTDPEFWVSATFGRSFFTLLYEHPAWKTRDPAVWEKVEAAVEQAKARIRPYFVAGDDTAVDYDAERVLFRQALDAALAQED